ncbi:hypothetical protein CP532_2590 [Ophiocordyceps camponoti-leonardi (nom. inval.)]|nr:hypothetical protein CP532_2590 [Ophiocordyceps camponoti-leonardi (nom. inval.)]
MILSWIIALYLLSLNLQILAYRLALCVHRIFFHPLSRFKGPWYLSASYIPHLIQNCVTGTWVDVIPKLHRKYGPIVRIGPNHLSIDGSLAWTQVFLYRDGREYLKQPGFHGPQGQHSIIGAPSTRKHRSHRRQLARGFNEQAIIDQESVVSGYVDKLVRQISHDSERGEAVNVVDWFKFLTFDVIGDLTQCESFQCLDKKRFHDLALMIFTAIRGNGIRRILLAYTTWEAPPWVLKRVPIVKWFLQVEAWIFQRARARISLGVRGKDGRSDFFSQMLSPRDGEEVMTEQEMLANALLLIVAGGDTAATALSGLFFYLAQNRKAYDTLAEEVRGRFKEKAEIGFRSCATLPFLNACVQETMRLYPPSPEIPTRVSPGDVIDGREVPAGTLINVYASATGRNPSHFSEPDLFRPERWLPPTHALYDPTFRDDDLSVSKPFSYGPRDCLGQSLALHEIRLTAARLLFHFDFEMVPGQEGWKSGQRMFVVWEKPPLFIRFRRR